MAYSIAAPAESHAPRFSENTSGNTDTAISSASVSRVVLRRTVASAAIANGSDIA